MNLIKENLPTEPNIYRFRPHNHTFKSNNMEWKQLKNAIAYWNKKTSNYPYVRDKNKDDFMNKRIEVGNEGAIVGQHI
jgi:hypothetical protein